MDARRGLVALRHLPGDIRPLDGALAQLDVAFARDDGPLRADHRYATDAQLDELYRSWGY